MHIGSVYQFVFAIQVKLEIEIYFSASVSAKLFASGFVVGYKAA